MKELIKNITYLSAEDCFDIQQKTIKRMREYRLRYIKKTYASHISASKVILNT
jgi:hypothetical protein